MKYSKNKCVKTALPPKPNLKNKDFVKWSKSESYKKDDNIISTDWPKPEKNTEDVEIDIKDEEEEPRKNKNLRRFIKDEKLKKIAPFNPVYDNAPLNMVYLLSGEYGRIWQKERDEWYSNVFTLNSKEKDIEDRKKKFRKQAKEAKKAAEINIKERKERKIKEAEIKSKTQSEKTRAKLQKNGMKKKPPKKQELKTSPLLLETKCECSHHEKEANETIKKLEQNFEKPQNELSSTLCRDYYEQLKDVQIAKGYEIFNENKINPEQEKAISRT